MKQPPEPAVALDSVTLFRNRQTVLQDLSLSIEAGEFIAVLGPNGSGKSTLFRALMGLLPGTQGTVRIFGLPAKKAGPVVGYLPQMRSEFLEKDIQGWDFVASAQRPGRLGLPLYRREDKREIDAVIGLVDGVHLARRPLSALSGGERQRLLLAQALLGQPRLLLLDEPLASLDPRFQARIVELIKRIQQERQVTVLFSSHELNPLLGAMDRVLYLGGGEAAIGTVDQVLTGPTLSRLYGMPIEVVRAGGRYFVVSSETGRLADSGAHHVCL